MKKTIQSILLASSLLAFAGCATTTPRDARQVAANRPDNEQIRWPTAYDPATAVFYVQNKIDIDAPPQRVWDIITDVKSWPEWYEGASHLTVNTADQEIGPGVVVSWRTMGLNFDSHVKEFEPPFRFGWESRKAVIRGYHAWLLVPTETGTRVITEETFHGFLAYMQRTFIPNKLFNLHQAFLEGIKELAERP
jgi:uncharacterized protein YndB with AHSA1/START domain